MNILLFLLLPILVVTGYAVFVWARNRQPSSVEAGVDAFRREMSALSPDHAPQQRRPSRPTDAGLDPPVDRDAPPSSGPPPVEPEARPPRRPGPSAPRPPRDRP